MVGSGVELLVGMVHDPLFGPVLACGAGGTAVELLRDVAIRITPITDLDAREMLGLVLKQMGAEVCVAASAQEARNVITQWHPHVMVSDVGMPEEDGYALINQIRALEPAQGPNLQAVALTGYAGEEDRSRLLAAGFQRYFPKPVEINELANAVVSLAKQAGKETPTPTR